jgi:zinc transporter ZupT
VTPEVAVAAPASRARVWIFGLLPLVLLAALIFVLMRVGPSEIMRKQGAPPVERLAIERAVLGPDGIQLSIMNDGPDPVTVAQVTVDDAFWAFSATDGHTLSHLGRTKLVIPYPWVEGEAHLVKVITSTGTTFEHEIAVAVSTPGFEPSQLIALALIGVYVGVIPVALGLMWFPLVARLGPKGLDVLLALTVGLLLFLLVDAVDEGLEASAGLPGSYQGVGLFIAALAFAYLSLEWFGDWLKARRARVAPAESASMVLALLIAAGIGLHNFGEGLAIGAAFSLGEAALGTLLVVGFTLHNTTEGLAIVAPIAKDRPSIGQLIRLGLLGGLPTIAGAWVGGLAYSAVLSVVFLGLGAGAIAQVALQIARQMAGAQTIAARFAHLPVMSGLIAGFLIMLATGMLVG